MSCAVLLGVLGTGVTIAQMIFLSEIVDRVFLVSESLQQVRTLLGLLLGTVVVLRYRKVLSLVVHSGSCSAFEPRVYTSPLPMRISEDPSRRKWSKVCRQRTPYGPWLSSDWVRNG